MSKCYKIKHVNLFVCRPNNVIVSFQLLIIQTLFQNLGRVKEPTRSPPALRWTRGESSAGEFLTDYIFSLVFTLFFCLSLWWVNDLCGERINRISGELTQYKIKFIDKKLIVNIGLAQWQHSNQLPSFVADGNNTLYTVYIQLFDDL